MICVWEATPFAMVGLCEWGLLQLCVVMATGGANVAKESLEKDTREDDEDEIAKFCTQLDDYTPTVRMN